MFFIEAAKEYGRFVLLFISMLSFALANAQVMV